MRLQAWEQKTLPGQKADWKKVNSGVPNSVPATFNSEVSVMFTDPISVSSISRAWEQQDGGSLDDVGPVPVRETNGCSDVDVRGTASPILKSTILRKMLK